MKRSGTIVIEVTCETVAIYRSEEWDSSYRSEKLDSSYIRKRVGVGQQL